MAMRKMLFVSVGLTYDDNIICISDCSGSITRRYSIIKQK
jgi:hypothetical protein